ncbi:MAG TPA: hypothetical protein DC057_11795 [Spirochaetia bacterium]|nr:hypothetical protein [Spirochaetia bacterium]HJZ23642.1 hypothetical protein [Candidatus Babeliales bacterium]
MAKKSIVQKMVVKALASGVALAVIVSLTAILMNMLGSGALVGALVLIGSSLAMVWAMKFRQGREDLLEAMVSLGLIYGLWALVGALFKFNPLTTMSLGGLAQTILFLTQFFIAEGVTQRLLKKAKLI